VSQGKRRHPSPGTLFRKVYGNAKKISESGHVQPQQFVRYVYHQIGRLEGHLAATGKWYRADVIQGFVDFQQKMEDLLPPAPEKV
jgi:hypothetical protein